MESSVGSQPCRVDLFFSPEKWDLFNSDNNSFKKVAIKVAEAFALAILTLTVLYPMTVAGYWCAKNCCSLPDDQRTVTAVSQTTQNQSRIDSTTRIVETTIPPSTTDPQLVTSEEDFFSDEAIHLRTLWRERKQDPLHDAIERAKNIERARNQTTTPEGPVIIPATPGPEIPYNPQNPPPYFPLLRSPTNTTHDSNVLLSTEVSRLFSSKV